MEILCGIIQETLQYTSGTHLFFFFNFFFFLNFKTKRYRHLLKQQQPVVVEIENILIAN